MRIALYNKNFKMSENYSVMHETVSVEVRSFLFDYNISMGNLHFSHSDYEKTYLLLIDCSKSEKKFVEYFGSISLFGSHYITDLGEEAEKIAMEFCKKNNLILNNVLNNWPIFQAICSKI